MSKQPGATDQDPAVEVQRMLARDAAAPTLEAADRDMRWAVAMLAELLNDSPYAREAELSVIQAIVNAQIERDAYRHELAMLLETYAAIR